MPKLEFRHFTEYVAALWPRYKLTPEMLRSATRFDNRIAWRQPEEVKAVLDRHRGEYPDDLRPHWGIILGAFHERDRGRAFEALLAKHRYVMQCARDRHPEQWSDSKSPIDAQTDEEIWMDYLSHAVRPIVYNPHTGELYEDDNGQRKVMATQRKEVLRREWKTYLEDIGAQVPCWL